MTIERYTTKGGTIIMVDGAFDSAAACFLRELVGGVETDAQLTLDFREVRLFHDSAITQLAAALTGRPQARLVGLSEHHYRLLKYVADVGAAGAPQPPASPR